MSTSSETTFLKLVLPAGVLVLRFTILALVIISMIEAFDTLTGVIRDLGQTNKLIFFGVLTAVLMPAGGVFFWGCKAVSLSLEKPVGIISRYFQDSRGKKSPIRGRARSQSQSRPQGSSGSDIG
jgi:hypothetical protein